jgi:hypothetical protein
MYLSSYCQGYLGSSQTYGTGNITWIYEVCKQYFGLQHGAQTVDEYYNQVVAICKERNIYQPLSTDPKTILKQCQDMDVV